MVIAALVSFAALLAAWILAPDDAERRAARAATARDAALEPELAAA